MIETTTESPSFKTVPNDPINVKSHTLSNGLQLFMSVNKNEPRIYTNIVVRAGSKQDPAETTGLAHYMEHMLFKGTSEMGAIDWEKEEQLLKQISDLYEKYRFSQDETERLKIYQQIDQLSFEASKLAAPNEYDKLASALGAKQTNAYTWVEQTVFVNDIPANELEGWLKLESERFRMMALRLFHTELETVYEEFNISQDRDYRKANNSIRQALFPKHPYGTQTTIGSAQHLKNPSQVKIQEYFKTYYVPNNMAIVLAGDFDPKEAVALLEKYFGDYQSRPIPPFSFDEQPEIQAPIRKKVLGQEAPYIDIAWRFNGSQTDDQFMLAMVRSILFNHRAGLLDIELNQLQQVLESNAWCWFYEDYSVFGLYGKARAGQSLEDVEKLLLAQIQRIKEGDFEDWLLEAILKDFKLDEIRAYETNKARVNALTYSFILGIEWERFVHRLEWLGRLDKQQIIDFAQERFAENYVVIYKEQGDDPGVVKVDKPPITPVQLNRDATSVFAQKFLANQTPRLQPQVIDFDQYITSKPLSSGIVLDYVNNPDNELFRLDYIFEMGKNSDRDLALALIYLPYLGTNKYSASELQKEFFRLGLTFDVFCNDDRSYVTLSGLDESLEEGIQLFEHILANVEQDKVVLENVVSDLLVKRVNIKKDKNFVLRQAMSNYARYGIVSPFTYRHSEEQLRNVKPEMLIERIHSLTSYEHCIYYYGKRKLEDIGTLLEQSHPVDHPLQPVLPPKDFPQLATSEHKVLFLDFPMVQVEILLISRGTPHFNLEEYLMHELYNEYFGYGLSSIVFQEIRESKALAYSTYALYSSPSRKERSHYLQAFVGTQPDKLIDAIPALVNIIEKMPMVESQIENARQSLLKRIESERLLPSKIYWEYRSVKDRGHDHDLQKDLYDRLQEITPSDLFDFHRKHVKGRHFTFLVIGNRKQLNMEYLETIGKIQEVTLEEVFGY